LLFLLFIIHHSYFRILPMKRFSAQKIYVACVLTGCALLVGYVLLFDGRDDLLKAQNSRSPRTLAQIPFDGTAAMKDLTAMCDLGPRPSGSAAMKKQQEMLVEHFQRQGAKVERQEFTARDPKSGAMVPLANLIVHWHPDRRDRVMVSAHYDTRPFPDRDASNPRGRFIGANDGGSGVAVLMELGRFMPKLPGAYGVDFVLFDGEELVYAEGDEYFLGSKYFARQYVNQPPAHHYRFGLLLDMVGDAQLRCFYEPNSMRYAPTVTRAVWDTARRLGVYELVPQMANMAVNDDHMPLNEIAHIPTCDLIDFDYPYWHTQNDLPAQCSALSLAKIGWVVHEWLKTAVRAR
jgi:hypothetical protein